jgi:hypothetical protein
MKHYGSQAPVYRHGVLSLLYGSGIRHFAVVEQPADAAIETTN